MTFMKKLILCAINLMAVTLLLANGIFAARFQKFHFKYYTPVKGLPSLKVNQTLQDKDGYIWFATSSGLCRYDGQDYHIFLVKDGLPSNEITTLAIAGNKVWIGTEQGLVLYNRDSNKFETTPVATNVLALFIDQKNNVWVSYEGGLGIVKNDKVEQFYNDIKIPQEKTYCITQSKDGVFWFGTNDGAYKLDPNASNDNLSHFTVKQGFMAKKVYSVSIQNSDIWLGTDIGLILFNGKEFIKYSADDSQAHINISSILPLKNGDIWFASKGGLSRKSGNELISYTTDNGLPHNHISHLFLDKEDNLWISTNGGGVCKLSGEKFFYYDVKWRGKKKYIYSIFESNNGELWFGGDGIISHYKYKDNSWVNYYQGEIVKGKYIRKIFKDILGNLWFLSDDISRVTIKDNKRSAAPFDKDWIFDGNDILAAVAVAKEIWIGTTGGIYTINGNKTLMFQADKLAGMQITSIIKDNRSIPAFEKEPAQKPETKQDKQPIPAKSTKTEEKTAQTPTASDSKKQDKPSISKDTANQKKQTKPGVKKITPQKQAKPKKAVVKERNKSTKQSKTKKKPKKIKQKAPSKKKKTNLIKKKSKKSGKRSKKPGQERMASKRKIKQKKTIKKSAAKSKRIRKKPVHKKKIDKKSRAKVKKPKPKKQPKAKLIKKSQPKTVAKPQPKDEKQPQPKAVTKPQSQNEKKTTAKTQKGKPGTLAQEIWFASRNNGIFKVDKNRQLIPFPKNERLKNKGIHKIYQDKQGNIWILSLSGVYKVNDVKDSVQSFSTENGLQVNHVLSIHEDNKGVIWLGTNGGGLSKIDANGKITTYTTQDGLSDNFIYTIISDKQDNIWMTTNRALDKYDGKQFLSYNVDNGLNGNMLGKATAIYFDHQDNLWVGTTGGMTQYISKNDIKNPIAPKLILDYVKLNKTAYKFEEDTTDLAYDENNLDFHFVGLSFRDEKGVRYQYFLQGKDQDWLPLTNNPYISYSNLDPGDYVLKVRCQNQDGLLSTETYSAHFIISPPFWETSWFIISSIIILLTGGYTVYKWRMKKIEKINRILEEKVDLRTKELRKEKEVSENLLLNILPQDIASELKESGYASPRYYDSVSVMFTDFKGFTQITEKLSAEELVRELQMYFEYFDDVVRRYHLEKLKTIGDSYMCAGGLPEANYTHHIDAVMAGIEIQDFMNNLREVKANYKMNHWELRLGIHTGPVMAGIVGKTKFLYDIWGDSVNMASRMESSSEPGKINISETTYQYVKDIFHCEPRGKILAKNKGLVEMYFVQSLLPRYQKESHPFLPNDLFWEKYNIIKANGKSHKMNDEQKEVS